MDRSQHLQRLREQIKERVLDEQQEERSRLRERRKAKAKFTAAQKTRAVWVREHEPKAREAAGIVWNWYEQFIASEEFRAFSAAFRGRRKEVKISRTLTCSTPDPHPGFPDLYSQEKQLLGIDASGTLYVHNIVKYGKAFPLCGEDALLEHVGWPILVEIAETITHETIWGIVGI